MFQFVETIKVEHQKPYHLSLHQVRVDKTFYHFNKENPINLKGIVQNLAFEKGIYKLRVLYNLERDFITELECYTPPKIASFQLMKCDEISYDFKFLDREIFAELKKKSIADEIIIVKDNNITDTSFSNLIFLKNGIWHTPSNFLLNGVQRQNLLLQKKIVETEINLKNLYDFSHFQFINAMNTGSEIFQVKQIISLF